MFGNRVTVHNPIRLRDCDNFLNFFTPYNHFSDVALLSFYRTPSDLATSTFRLQRLLNFQSLVNVEVETLTLPNLKAYGIQIAEMTETQLIAGCRNNDRRAQKALYDRYSSAMFSTVYRITGNKEIAAEILQDGFLKVFLHINTFEERSTLGAWIKRIMIRTALSTLRKKIIPVEAFTEIHDSHTLDWGIASIDAEYLEKAILQLPDGYRAVFLLAEVEGYTHAEIGTLLEISEGTSKSQLWNAKKRLRGMLIGVYG